MKKKVKVILHTPEGDKIIEWGRMEHKKLREWKAKGYHFDIIIKEYGRH